MYSAAAAHQLNAVNSPPLQEPAQGNQGPPKDTPAAQTSEKCEDYCNALGRIRACQENSALFIPAKGIKPFFITITTKAS